MRPNSVCAPVAKTTALPAPATTVVPMNTTLRASSSVVCDPAASAVLRTGALSPVSGALFTRSSCASTTRQSADTASPASNTTTSPGTRSEAGHSKRSPSRRTRQVRGTRADNASAVRSAEYSMPKPIAAFNITTAMIANASSRLLISCGRCNAYAMNVSVAAANNTSANKSVNCSSRRLTIRGRLAVGSSFRPACARLASISAAVSPRVDVARALNTSLLESFSRLDVSSTGVAVPEGS